MTTLILGLDFGGTKLAAGVVGVGETELRAYRRQPTPTPGTPSEVLSAFAKLAQALAAEVEGTIVAVGASFGGPLAGRESGTVQYCPHLPGWEGYPLQARLAELFGVPAAVENDANAAAVGEWRYGAGRNLANIIYITVSTGIGSGLVLNGQLYRGYDGLAGELGHIPLVLDGPTCTCGRRGCLESLASGPAIARQAQAALEANPQRGDLLRAQCHGQIADLTARDVAAAANQGDELAREVLTSAATYLGWGIAIAASLVNPARVILGGGVIKSGQAYLDTVRAAAATHCVAGVTLDIVKATYDDLAPLWGALALGEALAAT